MTDETPIEDPPAEPVSVTLTQHLLGMEPYVLLTLNRDEAEPSDPADNGLRLGMEYGGGVDEPAILCLLAVLNMPVGENPLTAAVKAMLDQHPDELLLGEALAAYATFVGFPMPEGWSAP